MTAAEYRAARQRAGTQEAVAAILGVDPQTISRRERGELPITREAALALLSLPKKRKAAKPQNSSPSAARKS